MRRIQMVALLAALVFFMTGYILLTPKEAPETKQEQEAARWKKVTAVVAKQDIPIYAVLTQDMVEAKEMMVAEKAAGYFTDIDEVVGMVCVSDIFTNELLTVNRIVKEGDVALGLAHQLDEGMRAFSISVDVEKGVANTLKVGNRVDVLYAGAIEGGSGETITAGVFLRNSLGPGGLENSQVIMENMGMEYSAIIMQDLRVAALSDVFYFSKNGLSDHQYGSVTLEVTPQQAAQLLLLKSRGGVIQLILRPQEDHDTVSDPQASVYYGHITETETPAVTVTDDAAGVPDESAP